MKWHKYNCMTEGKGMPKAGGNEFVTKLGRLIQLRRESMGLSREALAEKTGTKYEVIRLYEEGQRVMKVDRLFEILEALDVPVMDCLPAVFAGRSGRVLRLVSEISALDSAVCDRLVRQMEALTGLEKSGS